MPYIESLYKLANKEADKLEQILYDMDKRLKKLLEESKDAYDEVKYYKDNVEGYKSNYEFDIKRLNSIKNRLMDKYNRYENKIKNIKIDKELLNEYISRIDIINYTYKNLFDLIIKELEERRKISKKSISGNQGYYEYFKSLLDSKDLNVIALYKDISNYIERFIQKFEELQKSNYKKLEEKFWNIFKHSKVLDIEAIKRSIESNKNNLSPSMFNISRERYIYYIPVQLRNIIFDNKK